MTAEKMDLEQLRGAFAALSEKATPTEACPQPERLWKAVRRELTATERGQLVEHTITCGACAEAWRLARVLEADLREAQAQEAEEDASEGEAGEPAPVLSFRRILKPVLAMAAALALVAIGLRFADLPGSPHPSEFRAVDDGRIHSLVEPTSLPREAFELKWSDTGEGSAYELQAGTESLEPISLERGLTQPSFHIPAEKLAQLHAGSKILWRVDAVLPDGSRLSSVTFETLIE